MFNESATPLAAFLKKIASTSGLDKKLQEISVLDYWEEVLGTQAAKSCVVTKIEHGILTVHTNAPVWRTELQMRKTEVIQKLNECIGAEVVRDIVFR